MTIATSEDSPADVGFSTKFVLPILIGPMLNPLNSTMIAVALVPIATALQISAAKSIWLVAILYLVAAVSQPVLGTLADVVGPKKVYVAGLAITAFSALLPLIFHSFVAAMLARVLIGIGTSSAYPSAMKLIRERSTELGREPSAQLLSALSISSLVTSAVGPAVGGVLVLAFGWEAIFAVNLPLAGATMIFALLWLPPDNRNPDRAQRIPLLQAIDVVGIILFSSSIAMLLLLLLTSDWSLWALGVASFIGFIVFTAWELSRTRPFIDVRLLATNRPLARTYLRLLLTFTILYLFVNAFSQWLQTPYGLNASQAGLAQVPIATLAGIVSFFIARNKRVYIPLLATAAAPILTGLVFAFIGTGTPLLLLVSTAMALGISQGFGSVANQTALYYQAPSDKIGNAAGLSRTSIYLGAILSSSLIGRVFGTVPTDHSMNIVGWTIACLAVLNFVLTLADSALIEADTDREA